MIIEDKLAIGFWATVILIGLVFVGVISRYD